MSYRPIANANSEYAFYTKKGDLLEKKYEAYRGRPNRHPPLNPPMVGCLNRLELSTRHVRNQHGKFGGSFSVWGQTYFEYYYTAIAC